MEKGSSNNIAMQQPLSLATRFIWVIKDFSEFHDRSVLKSPEFFLNGINGIEEKFKFKIIEFFEQSNESEDDSDGSEDEYKLILEFNSKYDTVRRLDIIYSVLDKNGKIIHDEQRSSVKIEPNHKMNCKFSLMETYDMKELIFRHGFIVMHICIINTTLDPNIIINLINSQDSRNIVQSKIPQQFINFYESKDLSDFVIKVENKEYNVHKFALAASSPVFAALFVNEAKTNHDGYMIITDATATIVQEMLHYVYTGNVPKIKEYAKELLKIAHKYSLEGLVKICECHLKKTIKFDNVLCMLAFAIKYNLEDLKYAAHTFFIANIKKILDGEEFNEFINSYAFSFDNLI